MGRAAPPDPAREMFAEVVAQNPRLRARAESIMEGFLDNVERAVKIGDPQTMATYARVILPSMMRSLRDGEREAGEDAKVAAMRRIMSAVRGEGDDDDG